MNGAVDQSRQGKILCGCVLLELILANNLDDILINPDSFY